MLNSFLRRIKAIANYYYSFYAFVAGLTSSISILVFALLWDFQILDNNNLGATFFWASGLAAGVSLCYLLRMYKGYLP